MTVETTSASAILSSIRYVKGIGPHKEKLFNILGIYTQEDLLYYFPVRYEDRSAVKKIKELRGGEKSAVRGTVMVRNVRYLRNRKSIFEVLLRDDTGKIKLLWFNQPYLKDSLQCGDELFVFGTPQQYRCQIQFICPVFEKISQEDPDHSLQIGRIVPVYSLTAGLNQNTLRKTIYELTHTDACAALPDPIPKTVREQLSLTGIHDALTRIHFPSQASDAEKSRERFIFEELFASQILVYLRKARVKKTRGVPFSIDERFLTDIKRAFPFSLTPAQEKVSEEILQDMRMPTPMHRLLQGDVGSGKTVVAALAIAVCAHNRYQAALMVPTEVLAIQHYETLQLFLKGCGAKIALLLGSMNAKKKQEIQEKLEKGSIDVVVGTHALIQEQVHFHKLGLVVIDEQHRFGVAQRVLLPKKGSHPDILVMSATPIPRSLALTLYGDLDISVIETLPLGRKKAQNTLIDEKKRGWMYQFIKDRIAEGRQIYFIYPLIEDSDTTDIKAAETMYDQLRKTVFKGYRVGLLHGRLKTEEKFAVLHDFKSQQLDILISTTVIEVGIDVSNANCMIVEHPERFGLSQLHQLRGRVCRSTHQPYFIMITANELPEPVYKRLSVIVENTDGFKIAEADLQLRGPGDFFGNFQHGFPENRIANPLRDLQILQKARECAYSVVKNDPSLQHPDNQVVKEYIRAKFFAKNIRLEDKEAQ